MRLTLILFIVVQVMLGCISCTSTKKTVYFYNVQDTTYLQGNPEKEPLIQPNDILSITIGSLNADASALYNLPSNNAVKSTTATGASTEIGGYLVGTNGTIQLLGGLGSIQAAGLTKTALRDNITSLILSRKVLVDPSVEIRFLNYEVTVLGEVAKPTVITVPNERISLLKALGLAGDLTIFGRRDNVLLIREENGKKKTRHIDLNSGNFFNSPFYYLQPNDVVYVQPNKAKVASAGRTQQLLPLLLSVLSIIVVVLDRVKF